MAKVDIYVQVAFGKAPILIGLIVLNNEKGLGKCCSILFVYRVNTYCLIMRLLMD